MLTPNVNLENKTLLVTGAAGFIGANLVMELLRKVKGVQIVGLDNMNNYYDVSIKEYRLQQIEKLAEEHPMRAGPLLRVTLPTGLCWMSCSASISSRWW